jgi:hypothetical protein
MNDAVPHPVVVPLGNFVPAGNVRGGVKRLAVLAFFASVLAACAGTGPTGPADATDTTATVAGRVADEMPTIMAAALEELVTENHTFGEGPPPFTEYLLQSHTDVRAGSDGNDGERRLLTAAERDAIEDVVRPFGPVRWIDDPDEWRTEDLRPTIDGSVILGVGEPTIDRATALVPVSLWCGGLCGTWLTYRLDAVGAGWRVRGTEGPITIA